MPDLSTDLHVKMLRESKQANSLPRRVAKAVRRAFQPWVYGAEWGVIEDVPPLLHVLERWVKPYVKSDQTALEIGPGGGRWTRHLLGFRKLYLVEYYDDLLAQIKAGVGTKPNVVFVKNNGNDFPGVPDASIDFLFSFGVFVHIDFAIIETYLDNMKRIMKPDANIVLHFGDKNKVMAAENDGFAHNTPEMMRAAILARGYNILEEDNTLLWHSGLVRFTLPR
jgi:Methyltransferase domain